MDKIKITLISLGNTKFPVSFLELESWKSALFDIQHGASVGQLPDAEGDEWQYTDGQLSELVHPEQGADFAIGIINAPLEDNYYLRRLSDKVAVLSLYEMADIVRYSEFTIEQYILRNVYELAVLFAANRKLIPPDYTTWAHDEVRGCLFDMNSSKTDIVFSMHRPTLCPACSSRVLSKQVPAMLIPALQKELPRIQKPLFARMSEWVKQHPLLALLITALEKAKRVWPWLA
jgi:DNA-directed RNA polymerase subunit RPC12/RpoP